MVFINVIYDLVNPNYYKKSVLHLFICVLPPLLMLSPANVTS